MGKDREGKFHPRKGSPSNSMETEEKPLNTGADSELFDDQLEDLTEKYTEGDGEPASNLRLRHRNRNVDKRPSRSGDRESGAANPKRSDDNTTANVKTTSEEIQLPISKELFAELSSEQAQNCISIYIQTPVKGSDGTETVSATVFRNYLQQATAQLKAKDVDEITIDKLLAPSMALLKNDQFWREQSEGLCVLISDNATRFLKMPVAPKVDHLLVNTSFYLGPLIPIMRHRDYFYLLMLSKKQSKLYRASEFGIVELIIEEMPNGVDDVVHLEEKDDQKLFRTGSSGDGGGANYHGTGAGKPDDKENIALYFDEVDETIWKAVLNKENVPLLLAGVEYLIPIYKSVANYKPIWEEAITGNQQYTDLKTLHQQARKIMEPYFMERHKKALELYGNQSATELTSTKEEEIIPAAHYKRIWHLFVQEGTQLWGTFDEMNNKMTVHETQQQEDEDLIDKAVVRTILSAGEVHFLPKELMPEGKKLAAVMRY